MKEFVFDRKINYYETDKMGIVHHSNYIRFMEEGRCLWLEEIGLPFENLEANGITIPVLGVNVNYKRHVTFGDIIEIHIKIKEYNSVRMTVEYTMLNKANGEIVLTGETKHCFTDKTLRPVSLKKAKLEFDEIFRSIS